MNNITAKNNLYVSNQWEISTTFHAGVITALAIAIIYAIPLIALTTLTASAFIWYKLQPALLTEAIPIITQKRLTKMIQASKACYRNLGSDCEISGYTVTPSSAPYLVFTKKLKVIIAFRGTKEICDWLTNIKLRLTYDHDLKGYVHQGFLTVAESTFPEIRTILENHATAQNVTPQQLNITVTGHSLGGAVATICAMKLHRRLSITNMRVTTVASPRVLGNDAAIIYDRLLGEKTTRVIHTGDPVESVPPTLAGYTHVGIRCEIPRRKESWPHEIDGYLSGVLKV